MARGSHNRLSLSGYIFGNITVLRESGSQVHPGGSSHSLWECQCSCGSLLKVIGTALTSGNTKSCGCMKSKATSDRNRTHGMTGCRTYRIWQAMISRCRYKDKPLYKNYGGRGISVCSRWTSSFEDFMSDMGEAPDNHSIDRIDNNGNYEPSNCRWATRKEQSLNKRTNRIIQFNGVSKCLIEWANDLDIDQSSLRERLEKWPLEKALTQPKRKR